MLTLIYISQPRATLCPSEYIPLVLLFLLRKKIFFSFSSVSSNILLYTTYIARRRPQNLALLDFAALVVSRLAIFVQNETDIM